MTTFRITFSVNDYDRDGDVTDQGIYLHIGPVRIRAGGTVADLREIAKQIEDCASEIEDPESFHAGERAGDYTMVRNAIIAALDPPDDDAAEEAILIAAVERCKAERDAARALLASVRSIVGAATHELEVGAASDFLDGTIRTPPRQAEEYKRAAANLTWVRVELRELLRELAAYDATTSEGTNA